MRKACGFSSLAEAEILRPRHGLQAQAAQVVKREVVL
jgi:hypothetical protein